MKKHIALLFAILFAASGAFAKKTPVENLHQFDLDNGLTVFAAENHSVPLVYIEIAVRCGATTQTPETAGLFHLYEHMMFKGNSLNKDSAQVQKALSDMGVADRNGTTGTDRVNYFFTIPSALIEEGLAFWNAAIRSPLMDPAELENEKKVVIAELEGKHGNEGNQLAMHRVKSLFPNAPYRIDSIGSPEVVKAATVEQLQTIKSQYYVPSNAALFVGGDINPEEVEKLAEKIFGTWKNTGTPQISFEQQNTAPFGEMFLTVKPFAEISKDLMEVDVIFRGPDTDFNIEDTYAADYLCQLLYEPDGIFKQTLYKNKRFVIPDPNYVWGNYTTSKASGTINFGAIMLKPEESPSARAKLFAQELKSSVLPKIANTKSLYSAKKIREITEKLKDETIRNCETPENLLSTLRFWWTSCSPEYYYTYSEMLSKVTQEDERKFVEKYISSKNPYICVLINPEVYEAKKEEFSREGFTVITEENSVWWKDEKYSRKSQPSNAVSEKFVNEPEEIYVPDSSKKEASARTEAKISYRSLKNGIPVYIQETGDKIVTIGISIPGGIKHLAKETSGLEASLFKMMASCSKKYSRAKRDAFSYNTKSFINSFSRISGSVLLLNSLDKYLEESIDVFADGFMHPAFDKEVYSNMITEYRQNIQRSMTDPESHLDYVIFHELYKNHPFSTTQSVSEESISNITIEGMKALHKKLMKEKMFIVVSGSTDEKRLMDKLNKTFGKIDTSAIASTPMTLELLDADISNPYPQLEIEEGTPIVKKLANSKGTAFISRVFASPSSTSMDFMPSVIAGNIYSNILFNIVREKYGACYSINSYVPSSFAGYGVEHLYQVSDFSNFYSATEEARNLMKSGKLVQGKDSKGNFVFDKLEDRLESYKNQLVNATYSQNATSYQQAWSMCYNIMTYGDISYDKIHLQQIYGTTPEKVLEVFSKYWCDMPSRWFSVCGEDVTLDFQ